jgi:elongation factor G
MLNAPTSPNPLIEVAVEPTLGTGARNLAAAIGKMVADDPSFATYTDWETGQTIIGGIDELHLASKLDHLRRVHSLGIKAGAFQAAYRESIGCKSEITYTHKKHLGPMSQYARVKIIFEPGEPGSGFLFENKILDASVAKEYIPGVERGLALAAKSGWLAGQVQTARGLRAPDMACWQQTSLRARIHAVTDIS